MSEIFEEKIYDPIIIVKMGLTQSMIIPENNEVQPEILFEDLKEFSSIKRVMGLRSIYDELKFIAENNVNIWLYQAKNQLMIYSNSTITKAATQTELAQWRYTISNPDDIPVTKGIKKDWISEGSKKLLCKKFNSVGEHSCKYCGESSHTVGDVSLNDIMEE